MSPTVYQIDGPWSGQLAIVPRPRGGDWLDDALRSLSDAGFNVVVSLLTPPEAEELGVSDEAKISAKHEMNFMSFPIPDLGVPNSKIATSELLVGLLSDVRAGKKIAIHCRQGIGRSGLIASSLLVMAGIDPVVAFRKVSAARGFQVPETQEQRDWVIELAHDVGELAKA